MSGTSLDGIDGAILSTDGHSVSDFGPAETFPFTDAERSCVKEATEQVVALGRADARLLADADAIIVDAHVRAGRALLSRPDAGAVELIGYHGQTVLHRPERGLSIQIGDPARVAALLGIDLIGDVRQGDIAAGGEGAPLVPIYHAALAARIFEPRPLAFLNVGGVANFTFLGADGRMIAFDTGPGNGLLDLTVQARGLGRYDDGGALAAAGVVDDSVLKRLLGSAYFDRRGPKSLDRYDFPLDAVERLSDTDAAATLVAFTAESIAIGARELPEMPKLWIVCGGGRHNPFLMDALRQRLGRCESADAFGLRGDFIEAEAIGFVAARSALGLPLTYPETTGVAVPTCGGVRYAAHRSEPALAGAR